MSDNIKAVET